MLVDALIKADKNFDLMMYPGNRHGIRGAHGRHYNKLRLQHLITNLNPEIKGQGEVDFDLIWANE
jgi:dipeptidyl aminopeptidase/acylaminoacyl peptidase